MVFGQILLRAARCFSTLREPYAFAEHRPPTDMGRKRTLGADRPCRAQAGVVQLVRELRSLMGPRGCPGSFGLGRERAAGDNNDQRGRDRRTVPPARRGTHDLRCFYGGRTRGRGRGVLARTAAQRRVGGTRGTGARGGVPRTRTGAERRERHEAEHGARWDLSTWPGLGLSRGRCRRRRRAGAAGRSAFRHGGPARRAGHRGVRKPPRRGHRRVEARWCQASAEAAGWKVGRSSARKPWGVSG